MNTVFEDNCYLAVDFGGTKMLIGIVDGQNNIFEFNTYLTGFRDQVKASDFIVSKIDQFLREKHIQYPHIKAMGIGVVGNV